MTEIDKEIKLIQNFLQLCNKHNLSMKNDLDGEKFEIKNYAYVHHQIVENDYGKLVRIALSFTVNDDWVRITVPFDSIIEPQNWLVMKLIKESKTN